MGQKTNINHTASFALRPMTEEDLPLVLKWRNDPAVRVTAVDQTPISFETHLGWFKAISSGEKYIFTEDSKPIGVLLINVLDYWSFYLDPSIPKKNGYGQIMLSLGISLFKRQGRRVINAHVKETNIPSLNLHKKLGFKITGRSQGLYSLEYRPGW